MRDFFHIVRARALEVWHETNRDIIHAYDLLDFFVAWAVLLFISLVVAPLMLVVFLIGIPIMFITSFFIKKKPPTPPEVAAYKLKPKHRPEEE